MGWSDITMISHNLRKSKISSLLGIHNIRQQLYNTYIAKGPWRCIVRSNHKVKLSSNSSLILKQPAQNNITQRWTKGESLGKRFSRNAFLENEMKEPVWPRLTEKSAVQCYRSRDSFEHLGKAWLLPLWASAARGDRGIFHPILLGQETY